jgi:hypothetical protein
VSEWRKIWADGLPDEGKSPKSGHRMAAEGLPFPWRWDGGTISLNLEVIWGMSVKFFRSGSTRDEPRPFPERPHLEVQLTKTRKSRHWIFNVGC